MFRRFLSFGVALLVFTGVFLSSAWGGERTINSPSIGAGGLTIGGPKGEAELWFPLPSGTVMSPSRLELSLNYPEGAVSGTVSVFLGNVMIGSSRLASGDKRLVIPLSGAKLQGAKVVIRVLAGLSGGHWDDPSQDAGVQITSARLVLEGVFSMPKSVSQWLASLNEGVAVVVPNEARDEELSAGFALVGTLSRLLPGGRVVLIKASEELSEPFLPKVRVQLDDQQADGVTLDSGGANLLINGVSRGSLRDLCAKIFDPTLMGMMQGATVTGLSEASGGSKGTRWKYQRLSRSWAPGWSYELGDLFLWGGVVDRLSISVKGVVPLSARGEGALDLYVNGQLVCSERLEDGNVDAVLYVPDWVNLKVKNRLKLVVRGAGGPSSLQVSYVKMSYGKAYGMLGDMGALMSEGVPVLVGRDLKWTGLQGALAAFRWLCSSLPSEVPVFPDVRFYGEDVDVPDGFFIFIGNSLPTDMEDRLSVLYKDGQLKLPRKDVEAKLAGEAFWVMGQSLTADGGLAVLVPSRVEVVQEAFEALSNYEVNNVNQDGQVFFFGPDGLKVVDLGLSKPFRWGIGGGLRSLWGSVVDAVKSIHLPTGLLGLPEVPDVSSKKSGHEVSQQGPDQKPDQKAPQQGPDKKPVQEAPRPSPDQKPDQGPESSDHAFGGMGGGTLWILLGGAGTSVALGLVVFFKPSLPGLRLFKKRERRQSTLLTRRRRSRRR